MADKENQAHDFVRRRNWSRAVALYDQILSPAVPTSSSLPTTTTITVSTATPTIPVTSTAVKLTKDRTIGCLLGRCECLLELGKYESCISDAKCSLKMLTDQNDCAASIARVRRRLIHSLYKLKRFQEAEVATKEWITEASSQPSFADISKTLERYKTVIQIANGQKTNQRISVQRLDDEMSTLDTKLEHWATNNLPLDKYSKLLTNKGVKKRDNGSGNGNSFQKATELLGILKFNDSSESADGRETCSYCAISFLDKNELQQHCQTESHQNVIMSDEGRDWKWRPPPRGYTLDSYTLCESYIESQSCHYGNQCVEAHGVDELNEWKDRFEYRRMRLQRACEKELYGKSYTEELLEKWVQATCPEKIMCEVIDSIEENCSNELVTSISSKVSKREWIFTLKTVRHLKAVALLQDAHRHHFSIKSIIPGDININNNNSGNNSSSKKLNNGTNCSTTTNTKSIEIDLKSDQEWVSNTFDRTQSTSDSTILEHRIKVSFSTDIYGTFRQSVCFDFGNEPVLVKHLCVDVLPVGDAEKIQEIKKDIINSASQRWDDTNTSLVKFETVIGTHLKTEAYLNDLKREKELLERYPCPRAATFTLTQSTIIEKRLTKNNYRSRIHELLYVEEIARYEQIARYNLTTKLRIAANYMLTPSGMATSTAKYSHSGELFALMTLGKDVSEDTSAGRLILSSCASIYLSPTPKPDDSTTKKRDVYEAMIEDKGKNIIYLKLSAKCVQQLNLKADSDLMADIQFQLNRLSYCEWHNAVDKITDFRIIFPDTFIEPNIPWTPKKQWSDACEPKLNTKQREAVNAITTPTSVQLPPILLIGPFGTGKTYTLAQAIKQLLVQPDAKILICTHSNSAADLYIKEYLHPWVEKGMKEATPLRVYYHKRWVATVNSVVQKYCIIDGTGNFRRPTIEDIFKHRIVVVTLNISMELASLGLPKGYFTHIFLDEAAQAMECEAIMPLALANETTRIVLAGDHMQMSPELFSNFAKERKLHISLLERLYDHYLSNFPCKILLCENYRAHEAIIKFTSELFYEQKLIASGKQPKHDRFYPLTFFTTRGEDVQDKNSTAFYNNSEVYEVVERVCELRKKWPISWGKINDQSIGIMTPYADQVFRIRSELRKRRMGGISVERVLNVQGKQFRAIFLSTVRTRRTCTPNDNSIQNDDADYGFLSNSKLLNTAITRAQSLVAVVGDPVALCSIGRCRKVWERFIDICNQNKSLFGITWSYLRSQLDGVELKRSYVLNPLAPEFIPRALQPEAYLRKQAAVITANNQQQMPTMNQVGNHIPQVYSNHTFSMINQAALAAQMAQKTPPQVPLQSPMQMRPLGPPPQGYNMSGPPQVAHTQQQQFSPYMIWPQQQPPNQMIRPSYPTQPPPQPIQPPQTQNPNVSLWGPPPQTNPWGALPKAVAASTIRPTSQAQPPPQTQQISMSINLRPPAPPQPQLAQPPVQTVRNPHDISFLNKFVYQNANAITTQNSVVLNQVNARNPLHNSPSSPAMATPNHPLVGGDPNNSVAQQRGSHIQSTSSLSQHPYMLGPQAVQKDKEFQFLNNVHNIPINLTTGSIPAVGLSVPPTSSIPPVVNAAAVLHTTIQQQSNFQPVPDYSVLLPPNMNFYEMALEPKESQYKWYLRLLDTHGQEAAIKFTEILRQIMNTSQTALATTAQYIKPQPHPIPNQQQSRSSLYANSPATAGTDNNNANFNQQIDIVFNSLMNGNDMSQPILRDLLGMVSSTSSNSSSGSVLTKEYSQQPQQHVAQPYPNQLLIGNTNDMSGSARAESVPLYRRQVIGNGNGGYHSSASSSSNNQSIASSTPDHLFESNSTNNTNHNNVNLIESLFSSSDLSPYTSASSIQKLFYNYHVKGNDADFLMNSRIHKPSSQQQQQQQPQHLHQNHLPHSNINTTSNSNTTYAAVLSQGSAPPHSTTHQQQQQPQHNAVGYFAASNSHDDKDPFSAIRELGQCSNGFYNYFQ